MRPLRTLIPLRLCFLAMIFCWSILNSIADVREIPVQVTGNYFNSVGQAWFEKTIVLNVSDGGTVYLDVTIGGIDTGGSLNASEAKEMQDLLIKALIWGEKAAESKLETRKSMAAYTGVNLDFRSTDQGQSFGVILTIGTDPSSRTELYLNPEQIKVLAVAMADRFSVLKRLQENERKAAALN